MKRLFMTALTLATILGGLTLTSCQNGDGSPVPSQEQLATYLTGTWKRAMFNGESEYTDERAVLTFDGDGTGYASFTYDVNDSTKALYSGDIQYILDNNYIYYKLSSYLQETIATPVLFINDTIMTTQSLNSDGSVAGYSIYKKVKTDYSKTLPGLWQGRYAVNDSTILNYRINFLTDGAVEYFTMAQDSTWQKEPITSPTYLLDNDWLALSYKNDQGLNRFDFWDIVYHRTDSVTGLDSLKVSQYTLVQGKTRSVQTVMYKVKN